MIAHTDRDVVSDLTVSIGSTEARTWVNTLEVPALFVGGTVSIDDTLWSTGYVGITKVFRNTLAGSSTVSFRAYCIRPTRGRVAWVKDVRLWGCCRSEKAGCKWISNVARVTCTDWLMSSDRAGGMGSTNTRTGILTLVLDTGEGGCTFWIDRTLGFALNVWIPEKPWKTSAGSCVVSVLTNGIDSAGRWATWVTYLWSWGCC